MAFHVINPAILTWKPVKGHKQTVQTQIIRNIIRHLIRVYIVFLQDFSSKYIIKATK